MSVSHAGCVGSDGEFLIEELEKSGVRTEKICELPSSSGHAIIQVDAKGENTILLYPGANHQITCEQIDEALTEYGSGDVLLLQNEIGEIPYIMERAYQKGMKPGANHQITCEQIDEALTEYGSGDVLLLQNEIGEIPYIMERAYQKGMKIFFNPSPLTEEVFQYPLHLVSCFLVNRIEGAALAEKHDPNEILAGIRKRFPEAQVVLTLGKDGAYYENKISTFFQPAFSVRAVDTTAAGDTFTGYFIAELLRDSEPNAILRCACGASALAVSRMGAAPSIPTEKEVRAFLRGE